MATAEAVVEEQAEELDVIEPSGGDTVLRREWTVRDEFEDGQEFVRVYTQKPLAYFGKLEFFGLLAQGIDRAMAGPQGLTVDGMLGSFEDVSQIGNTNNLEIDNFVQGLARIAQYLPGLIEEAYCIFLNVPKTERPWVKDVWSRSEGEGGLSDEDGLAIVEVFLDDNLADIKDFFVNKTKGLRSKLTTVMPTKTPGGEGSPVPKPSKRTRARTPKQ